MFKSKKGLGPEAQRLVELTTGEYGGIREDVDLSQVLTANPGLTAGLGEYIKWRDEEMRAAEQKDEKQPLGHEISRVLKTLGPRK